ncbi:hypothetical protein NQ317_017265 [Molorchus minor]|uniref:Uncharacterized protein n=1 Tax=Molorchus minor TaxID=1323400 RepID=A0ABQ9JV05_9CUCU|nr:hypothetical protein NQ317_017265 [Molorchus minor]
MKRKYRENIRTLESENKGLTENVEKFENKLEIFQEDVLENITLEQYLKLTFKFCSSVEVANFINIQVAQERHLLKHKQTINKSFVDYET